MPFDSESEVISLWKACTGGSRGDVTTDGVQPNEVVAGEEKESTSTTQPVTLSDHRERTHTTTSRPEDHTTTTLLCRAYGTSHSLIPPS